MKRDMDLIREILLEVEQHDGDRDIGHIEIEGFSQDDIRYNVYLLDQAGFIQGCILLGIGSIKPCGFAILGMTWAGHDFLDAIRSDSVWAKVKGKLEEYGGAASFVVIQQLAEHVMRAGLGI